MNKTNVVPFERPAAYWRHRALNNKQSLRYADAVKLLLQAVAQEPENEELALDLAEIYSEMEAFEASNRVLRSLIARNGALAESYYGLACNYMSLGAYERVNETLACYLYLAPEGEYVPDAQEMLDMLPELPPPPRGARAQAIAHRAVERLSRGDYAGAERRLRRAGSGAKKRHAANALLLAVTLSARGQHQKALPYARAACARDPGSLKARTVLCGVLGALGRRRAATAIFRDARRLIDTITDEWLYCHAAAQLSLHGQARALLEESLRQAPYSTDVMHRLAVACCHTGDRARAKALWRTIASLDPEDQVAAYWQDAPESQTPPLYEPMLPAEETRRRMLRLLHAAGQGPDAFRTQWRAGEELPALARWAFTLPDARLQRMLLGLLSCAGDARAQTILREALLLDATDESVRRRAAQLLRALDAPPPYPARMDGHMTFITWRAQGEARGERGFRLLLRPLALGLSPLLSYRAVYGAVRRVWNGLRESERRAAVTRDAMAWRLSLTALLLAGAGFSRQAGDILRASDSRRVRRTLRTAARLLQKGGHRHEMH